MKVALIFGNYERQGFYPLGIMYLAAYLRKYAKEKINITLYDTMPDIDVLLKQSYDVIGFSCLTIQFPRVNKYASELRTRYNGIILAGGIHFSLLKQLPDWADFIILGEGEITFTECMDSISEYSGINMESFRKIPGLIFRNENGEAESTAFRKFISDLDTIPYPARDLVNMDEYLKSNNVFGTKVGRGLGMMTSRGCVFNCDFCSTAITWGNPRFHSAKYVSDEIKDVYEKYQIEYIFIEDDNFCGNKKRMYELADLMEQANLPVEIGASGRVEFITKEMLEVYKRIGIKALSFGLETGSDRMLKKIKDMQHLTVAEEIECVKMTLDAGIEVHGMFMINMPDETLEDMQLTKKIISEVPFSKITISLASPYYGTRWWDIAAAQGIVPANLNDNYWELYDMHSYAGDERPLFINDVPRETALELYEEINQIAKSRWHYDWRKRVIITDGKK